MSKKNKTIIKVEKLVKTYRKAETNAVDQISFTVDEGEFFAFLGPNGAGKTTTISILTTTLAKTSGKVTIAGYDLDKNPSEVRQSIGVIFQKPSLDENLTAEENVRFHAVLYGLYSFRPRFSLMPKEYKDKVLELASILGISEDLHKPIKTFSGGMKRKLEIIRSLMHEPKVLFLDEPTSGLDPASRKKLWKYIQDVKVDKKMTVFLTTHYLEEAEDADRVAIINKGKIIDEGTPTQIKKRLVENYVEAVPKSKSKLEQELTKKKIKYREEDGVYKISINGKNAHTLIKQIDSDLKKLDIHTPTLEEAYLEIIENGEEEHASS